MNENETQIHAWETESHHPTSEGVVMYQRCACGAWRIKLVGRTAEVSVSQPEITARAG
ncbi:hypothetical protein [Tsukamurella ocularis]|uniref:hypothetical protein n=1 Tax=Tsukamurella ocularis TaxID=1970234 RepID=UPI00216A753E|nr:hypothetical protein [Tsukamurella ocularis]MCS3780033.1 hypothetical protein [Tsukamurella ocularis]MCS3786413.1 hypothetical protein [Tsukamurella ocularis]MCS3849777.1 hypothetical protein [Tsukamurella ocularis]